MKHNLKQELQEKVGHYFKKRREELGYSLRQLDAEIGIDYSNIAKFERGESNLTLETLSVFMKFFKVQPNEVFDFVLDYDFGMYGERSKM